MVEDRRRDEPTAQPAGLIGLAVVLATGGGFARAGICGRPCTRRADRRRSALALMRRLAGRRQRALVLILWARAGARRSSPQPADDSLAALAGSIDWVAAADNYVELHIGGRVTMRRMTMREAERALAGQRVRPDPPPLSGQPRADRRGAAAMATRSSGCPVAPSCRSGGASRPTCRRLLTSPLRHKAVERPSPGRSSPATVARRPSSDELAILPCIVAVMLLSCLEARRRPRWRPIARARQVTASYNLDLVPSPDGKRAVLIKIIGGREQLFTMTMDGSGETQITRDDADHEDPVWSPDGRKIAFVLIKGGKKIVHSDQPRRQRRRGDHAAEPQRHPSRLHAGRPGDPLLHRRRPAPAGQERIAKSIRSTSRRSGYGR